MILKTLSIFTLIFITAFVIDCKTFADSETDDPDVKDSYEDKEELNIQSEIKSNETEANVTEINTNSSNVNNSKVHISCNLNKTFAGIPVEIVNNSRLAMLLHVEPNITSLRTTGHCVVVLFYSPSCPFSCMAAPHFNALQRFFPDIKMVAVNAMKYRSFNAQFGIVGTPTVVFFHNGRPAAKFSETSEYNLEVFAKFITKYTGIQPEGKLVVTSADFGGPVSSVPVKETDYYLLLSCLVIAARILYSFYHSAWGKSLMDATLNAWREAEAQHHHVD